MSSLRIVDEDGDSVRFSAGVVNRKRTLITSRRRDSDIQIDTYLEPDELERVVAFLSDRLEAVKDKYELINTGRVLQVMDMESKKVVACFELEPEKARKIFNFMNNEV